MRLTRPNRSYSGQSITSTHIHWLSFCYNWQDLEIKETSFCNTSVELCLLPALPSIVVYHPPRCYLGHSGIGSSQELSEVHINWLHGPGVQKTRKLKEPFSTTIVSYLIRLQEAARWQTLKKRFNFLICDNKRVNSCLNLPTFAIKPSYKPGLQVCSVFSTLSGISKPQNFEILKSRSILTCLSNSTPLE